ncbi:MAG: hypothetical protein M0P31_15440 [Solirubrobacteraceae bacterium]|nr:hypothetical protein [Solirubrobacteraceae bacterium]
MSKRGARILRIVGTDAPGPRPGKVGGEDVILVGDTDDLKGTKGDTGATGPAGPAWEPTVDTGVTLDLGAPVGVIEVGEGVYLPVYAEQA